MQSVVAHSSERMKFWFHEKFGRFEEEEGWEWISRKRTNRISGWRMDDFQFEHGSSWSVFVDGRRIRIHSSSTTMRCQMVKPDCPYHHISPILILDEMNYKLASLHVLHSISDRSRISREKRKREKFWKQFSKFVMCILKKEWKNLLSLVATPRFDLVRFVA